ncbi:hypothetical protein ACF3M2_12445 [Tissierella carlieri]|uniref:hypothetical protein n=1 Tax=Tissierella carlieri TaxID=689904 RepID=UPI0038631930
MSKRKLLVLLLIGIILVSLFYNYYKFKLNAVVEEYDFITLTNVSYTLKEILYVYENVDENTQVLDEYFTRFNTYSWYFGQSPRLSGISFRINTISDIPNDGITQEELNYLVSLHDKVEIFLNKINDERRKISLIRLQGAFRKSNVEELKAILDGNSI